MRISDWSSDVCSSDLHTLRNLIGDKAFFDAVRLLVYDRTDPKPGNYQQTSRATPDFVRFVKQTSGQEYQWLFDVYLADAALPALVETRAGDQLPLTSQHPHDKPSPPPLEARVGHRTETPPLPHRPRSPPPPPAPHAPP